MKRVVSRVRRPVKREGADFNLLITLLSFAASVSLTRLFLEATGYPQLGGSELHIAHVLWGGLLLFLAALAPLILTNRWVYRLGALLAGVGVGLFIDEVGKFITQSNDYFHPAAAPIIYALFLLTVLVYYRVRQPPSRSPRAELYRALDSLEELLDRDLDPAEHAGLVRRLGRVRDQSEWPMLAKLADQILESLQDESLQLAPIHSSFWDRWWRRWVNWEGRYLTAGRLRAALVGALLALGAWAVVGVVSALSPALAQSRFEEILLGGRLSSASQVSWFAARMALQATVGLILVGAVGLILAGRDRLGAEAGTLGLLLSLTTVNLLVFYFDQFSSVVKALIEFVVLVGLARYRHRLTPEDA